MFLRLFFDNLHNIVARHTVQRLSITYSTSPDRTTLPAQHFRSSGLLCRRSDCLELLPDSLPGAHQQQFQTIAENEPVSSLPLSTHSAVEMLYDSALYKSLIDMTWHDSFHYILPASSSLLLGLDLAWFCSVVRAPLCLLSSRCYIYILNCFCLHPSLYPFGELSLVGLALDLVN